MRQFLLITGVLLFWASCVSAADKVTISADDYKTMMRRMDNLQKQVNTLGAGTSTRRRGGSAKTQAVETKYDKLAQDMNDIYDTLDVVETKSLLDRINWGFELRERVDTFTVKDHFVLTGFTPGPPPGPTGYTIDDATNRNNWSTRFRLSMDSQISRGLSFRGRLTMYKNWADNDWNENMVVDNNFAHRATDSQIKVERAYVDWVPELPIPLAFTFGRLPVSEGPPNELKENRKRLSTYPSLLFDGETNGFIITLGLERYLKIKNGGLRYFYAKGYQDDDDLSSLTSNYLDGIGNTNFLDTVVSGGFFEGEIPKLRDSLFVLGAIRANNFTDNPTAPSANIGDMDLFISHFQFNNFMNSGVDFWLAWAGNHSHPNGQYGSMGPMTFGLLSARGQDSRKGEAFYTGVKYTLPVKVLKNPAFGFEYNQGSKYWFSFTPGSTELYNKLATRGEAYDIYYIQPFNRNLFMRFGYTVLKYDYSNSGRHTGEPMPINSEFYNTYALIEVRY